jgi:pectinesterase
MMNRYVISGLGLSVLLQVVGTTAGPLYDVKVSLDGSADFKSIQAAIDHAPNNHQPYVIYIRQGIYREKLEVHRPHIYLIGDGQDKTIITAATANGTINSATGKKFGTTGSRTVNIDAPDFSARSLTIENSFDFPANQAKNDGDPTKIHNTQAVALLISRKADRTQLKDVNLTSYQDTFYTKAERTFIDQSRISGTVDFIFGHGTALFENSNIVARYRSDVKAGEPLGYLTAPSTNINRPFGLVFKHCQLNKEAHVPAHSYALGRPWHPTTTFTDGRYADPNAIGHSAFIDCKMDDHIYGWDKMSGKDIHKNKIWFYPKDSRFREYHNTGRGARSTHSRSQLNDQQAAAYTTDNILSGWMPDISLAPESKLQGDVLLTNMVFPATITVLDSTGRSVSTQTDQQGHYQLSIAAMTPPLLVSADDHSGVSCLKNNKRRSLCTSALVVETKNNGTTTGNLNPFSDLIVSNLAEHEGFAGPQILVSATRVPALSHQVWLQANQHFIHAFRTVVEQSGLDPDHNWDPVSYSAAYRPVMQQLVMQVIHNRGYNTTTGLSAKTRLTDLAFRPIIDLAPVSDYQLSVNQLAHTQQAISQAKRRLFIVGDSTAANYPKDVYPRMGWGQAFAGMISGHHHMEVINAAQSGRSSRDFINERWLNQIEPLVKPGDYLLIQFSHNDEKCNGAKAQRGPIDVENLCTYPNNHLGQPQYPADHKEYSFQHSLEAYLDFAQIHQLHPIMLTALPRAKTLQKKPGVPISPLQHRTKQNKQHGYLFTGNYTQTVKDTAKTHHVPLLDLQTRVIQMANNTTGNQWKSLWLAVDPHRYPYYQGRTGTLQKPDTTHLQQKGADAVAKLVIHEIKDNPALTELARLI